MAKAKTLNKNISQSAKPNTVQNKLQQAVGLHQAGKLQEAQAVYMDVLQLQPNNADCLHLLGVISAQQNDQQVATNLIARAIKLQPNNPVFYCNLGNAQNALKEYSDAIASYSKAISLKPDFVDALYNLGNTYADLEQYQDSIACYDKVIKLQPKHALACYSKANVYKELNKLEDATVCYKQAIALKPNYAEAFYNLGLVQKEQEQYEAAMNSYNQAIAIRANYAGAYFSRAHVEHTLGLLEQALLSYQYAIKYNKSHAEAYYNYGTVLKALGQFEEAIQNFDIAIGLKADYFEAYFNRAFAFRSLLKVNESLASFDQAIACDPAAPEAYFAKSLVLLLTGNYQDGWALYEKRGDVENLGLKKRNFQQSQWDGSEPIAGKTVLLHSEQGLGDTIQFCRYAEVLAQQGARVILQASGSLFNLLNNLSGVSTLIKNKYALPEFDYHCPLMSLPWVCQTSLDTIPASDAYLSVSDEQNAQWLERLGASAKPRVGLVWSGNPNHKNDGNRSVQLSDLLPYLPEKFEYICLQKELRGEDQLLLEQNPKIKFFGSALADFTDTAALCNLVDVVISVDTSVAHLAAALGRPTWVMLPYDPDWRWLLERVDSPWYSSVTLYRQAEIANWSAVFESIAEDLSALI